LSSRAELRNHFIDSITCSSSRLILLIQNSSSPALHSIIESKRLNTTRYHILTYQAQNLPSIMIPVSDLKSAMLLCPICRSAFQNKVEIYEKNTYLYVLGCGSLTNPDLFISAFADTYVNNAPCKILRPLQVFVLDL